MRSKALNEPLSSSNERWRTSSASEGEDDCESLPAPVGVPVEAPPLVALKGDSLLLPPLPPQADSAINITTKVTKEKRWLLPPCLLSEAIKDQRAAPLM